ncbi:hypothetical protein MHYP_G00104510 [Metynnis hypsauchen]
MSGYLGENVTISCSYPEKFKRNTKFFFKQNRQHFTEKIRNSETQRGRFSISDDRRSKVLSVRISDVREDDGGVYFCGVSVGGQRFSYYSLYSETQLQVTGLLLIGALALIFYKVRGKKRKDQAVYENDLPGNQISMSRIYENLEPNNKQLDSANKCQNPNTNQSVLLNKNLKLNNKESDLAFKSFNPNTNQSDSVYQNISHSACDYEEITDTRATPLYSTLQHQSAPPNPLNTVYNTVQLPSNTPVQNTYSMVQLPKLTTEVHA